MEIYMSILDIKKRKVVEFDPKNKNHRRYVYDFLKNGNWSQSKEKLEVVGSFDNKESICSMLLKHFLEKEFKNEDM